MMASVEGALSADSDPARARLTADVRQKRLDYFAASAVASAYVIPHCSATGGAVLKKKWGTPETRLRRRFTVT